MFSNTCLTILRSDYASNNAYNVYTIIMLLFIVCESRTFGNNCSENCFCVSQQPCNKTTGTCPVGGCERGYKGVITCSTGM